MTRIINIRGTNGSGKTTLTTPYATGPLRQVCTYVYDGKEHPAQAHYDGTTGVAVIGRYVDGQCGGTDKLKTQDGVCAAVRATLSTFNPRVLMFEGLLVSGLYARYLALDVELRKHGHEYVWAFCRPTVEACMARVVARSKRTYDEEGVIRLRGNVESKHKAVESVRRKAEADGRWVVDFPTDDLLAAREQVEALVGGAVGL